MDTQAESTPEERYAAELAAVHPAFRAGARNLVRYLALRESGDHDPGELPGGADAAAHRRALLGPDPEGRDVSIMVTLPVEAATNPLLTAEMIEAGMNVARINCARDDPDTWLAMIRNVRDAASEADRECRVFMDLSGPKLRTGELEPGPRVIHIRPKRDPLGRVIAPRRIRFIPEDAVQRGTKAAVIAVPAQCIDFAQVGDEFRLRDTRGKKRRLPVVQKDDKGLVVESWQGAYIATGTPLRLLRSDAREKLVYEVGELPAVEQPLLLCVGDTLVLDADNIPGAPAKENTNGDVVAPAHIACQQPEVFEFLSPGDPVSLNDGKISGMVTDVAAERILIEITKAKPTGSRLRGNRGINFPKSDIRLPGLSAGDRSHLAFVAQHADAVNLSFVRKPADIQLLHEELDRYPDANLGIVVKIETKKGYKNLPRLMLAAMRRYPAAVMIARGDLAVECGWERLAELQEEILSACRAAGLPVIWATQVLEQEARKGLPSRAEITDAAASHRADCVMLNKGPHILAAIRMLDSILCRMQALAPGRPGIAKKKGPE